jgi:hypothetical protein
LRLAHHRHIERRAASISVKEQEWFGDGGPWRCEPAARHRVPWHRREPKEAGRTGAFGGDDDVRTLVVSAVLGGGAVVVHGDDALSEQKRTLG